MSDDIVTRLRNAFTTKDYPMLKDHCESCAIPKEWGGHHGNCLYDHAADEIERLRDELRRVIPFGDSAGVISELMADRDRWVHIAQLWNGAYSAQTYIHGLDEIETADMARKAQAKAERDED